MGKILELDVQYILDMPRPTVKCDVTVEEMYKPMLSEDYIRNEIKKRYIERNQEYTSSPLWLYNIMDLFTKMSGNELVYDLKLVKKDIYDRITHLKLCIEVK